MSASIPSRGEGARRRRWRVLAAGMIFLLLGGFMVRKITSPPSSSPTVQRVDPRLDYAGPFENVHPSVRYVGDARCADCHEDKVRTFSRHPMGRSLVPTAALLSPQPDDSRHHNPFEALGRRFWVEREGDRLWHGQGPREGAPDAALQRKTEVHYIIGSGARGRSYLTNHDGYLFQTPISWYSQKQMWDVSPRFTDSSLPERPITGMCLFCHANRVRFDEDSENHYQTPIFDGHAIGCERCHGPGERHVQNPGPRDPRTGADYTIVNPRRLEPVLREAVCQQCHLLGEIRLVRRGRGLFDFRPGLPLEQFWAIFVQARQAGEKDRAVNHVEQLHESRCFQESGGRMGCISCHDPHEAVGPERALSYYRERCLACHPQDGCSLPPAQRRQTQPDDSCIACHMPRYPASDIAHAVATDHRIPRQAAPPPRPAAARRPSLQMVPFSRDRLDPHDPEQARDLGIALVQAIFQGKLDPLSCSVSPLGLLEQAVQFDADDVDAWEARGGALLLQMRFREALASFETVLALSPRRERSLIQAAHLAQQLQQGERARRYGQRAVDVNPWMPGYRKNLALLLAEQHDWEGCGRQCEAWLQLDPLNTEARALWRTCQDSRTGQGAPPPPNNAGGMQR
jgi:hypothetical protein